ncbi:PA2778 family cysteine peptidase [Pelagibius marinus]|uniref:PA2778 family cysteine peptidase n=1 Tax=Pelagibius marinus TaxID=2762760 RepID=UPI0018727C0F|nr:PA2778 family cysteine peptidase [Pelagibius marinus]
MAARLPLFLLLLAMAACTAPQTARLVEDPADLPRQVLLEEAPFFPQTDYYCGPAALAMTLTWSGVEQDPDDLVSQVYTPGREGTLAPDIVAAARRHGRLAVELRNLRDLLTELAAGNPAIVFQNLALDWWPQWHFAVAVGYDLDRRVLILHSGTTERLVTPLDAFERTWARSGHWALLTLPPDQLPASTGAGPVLIAAAGLEQARRYRAAVTAYETASVRWPQEPAVWIGKGNALFALEQFAPAEEAFRAALQRAPQHPAAWNNLAYTLSRQGRRDEAVAAARKAVEFAGDDNAAYRDTLKEVSGP